MLNEDADWLAPVEINNQNTRLTGGENYYEYHTDTLWISSEAGWVSTHELNHFIQHCGTPYGFILQNLVDVQNRLVTDYFSKINSLLPNDSILVPVYPLAAEIKRLRNSNTFPSSIPNFDTVETLLQTYIYPWAKLSFLEDVFEGRDQENVQTGSLLKAIQALHHYENIFDQNLSENDWLDSQAFIDIGGNPTIVGKSAYPIPQPPTTSQDKLACPMGKWGKKIMPLGGWHIMEGLAQQTQASFLEKGATPDERALQVGNAPYWFLWHKTMELYGTQYGIDIFKTLEGYNKAYCTFIALCELALFVPAGFLYNRLRSLQTGWDDIHPARRFFKALTATPTVGWMDNLLPESIESFQNRICAVLGWYCPKDFLLLGSSLKLDCDVCHRHKEACKLRLENPTAFVTLLPKDFYKNPEIFPLLKEYFKDPNNSCIYNQLLPFMNNYGTSISHSDFLSKYPPIMYYFQAKETLIPSFKENQANNKLIRYFLSNWCSEVMLKGIPNYESLLPQNLQFDQIFNNIKSGQQYLEIIIRDNLWLNPERLKKWLKLD